MHVRFLASSAVDRPLSLRGRFIDSGGGRLRHRPHARVHQLQDFASGPRAGFTAASTTLPAVSR